MLETIYKWVFMGSHILSVFVYLYNTSRGEYQRTETPTGNAIGMLMSFVYALGFYLWCW